MSKNKNEKGFTLVLSLVLLLAMSLMGGSLIVIASSDHQSNNSSDEYQQTFYVAETALMQAEKSLIDTILGPLNIANGNRNTHPGPKQLPINQLTLDTDNLTPCYKSFRNLSRSENFKYVEHVKSKKFLDLFDPDEAIVTDDNERKKLSEFTYEYFSVNSGTQIYKAVGSSLKKTSSTAQRQGSTFKIYGCGMMGDTSKPEILIPLETIIVLSH